MGLDVAVCIRPMFGEAVSGDAAFRVERGDGVVLTLVDGTGHGPDARSAAVRAEAVIRKSAASAPGALLEELNRALKGLAGAAAGIAYVEPTRGRLTYAGVGNVGARVFGREDVRLVSAHGILGQRFPTAIERYLDFGEKDAFVMHSDGISERFDSAVLPELVWAPATKLAALLLSRFGKHHDDASCLVARMLP